MEEKFNFKTGDLVKVYQKMKEGKRDRTVSFEGIVIKLKGQGDNSMVSVRQLIEGILVDRIIPLSMPDLVSIEVVTPGTRVRGNLPRKADFNVLSKRLFQ